MASSRQGPALVSIIQVASGELGEVRRAPRSASGMAAAATLSTSRSSSRGIALEVADPRRGARSRSRRPAPGRVIGPKLGDRLLRLRLGQPHPLSRGARGVKLATASTTMRHSPRGSLRSAVPPSRTPVIPPSSCSASPRRLITASAWATSVVPGIGQAQVLVVAIDQDLDCLLLER